MGLSVYHQKRLEGVPERAEEEEDLMQVSLVTLYAVDSQVKLA